MRVWRRRLSSTPSGAGTGGGTASMLCSQHAAQQTGVRGCPPPTGGHKGTSFAGCMPVPSGWCRRTRPLMSTASVQPLTGPLPFLSERPLEPGCISGLRHPVSALLHRPGWHQALTNSLTPSCALNVTPAPYAIATLPRTLSPDGRGAPAHLPATSGRPCYIPLHPRHILLQRGNKDVTNSYRWVAGATSGSDGMKQDVAQERNVGRPAARGAHGEDRTGVESGHGARDPAHRYEQRS